jgi:hypothetical protein
MVATTPPRLAMRFDLMHSARLLFALASLAIAGSLSHAAPPSPYAGQEGRAIKALSEAEVDGLLAGKGQGFAKPAELNGYPGPAHVLELSGPLRLSQEQIARTRAIHARMEAEAKTSGAALVTAERELEMLFRSRTATPERLSASLRKASALQAKVREAHLRAHIEQTRVLSDEQIAQYMRLRGYTDTSARRHQGDHGVHHDRHPPR